MWPFNRKKKHFDFEFYTKDIPASTIMRWYLYDVALGEPNELAKLVGLSPISEEGDEFESDESNTRLKKIEHLIPFIEMIADIGAEVITGIQVQEIKDSSPDYIGEIEREQGQMRMMYKVVGLSALLGAFSSAMEIGLIGPGDISGAYPELRTETDNEQ